MGRRKEDERAGNPDAFTPERRVLPGLVRRKNLGSRSGTAWQRERNLGKKSDDCATNNVDDGYELGE